MPPIRTGALKGFYQPDYGGGSIVNLIASLIRARDGHSPHQPLARPAVRDLARADKIVYLLIDGLGISQLEAYLDEGFGRRFFAGRPYDVISSVFPATTAAAVTTYATGASPAEHGVLSWWLNLHDLGLVGNVLIEETRLGAPLKGEAFVLRDYLRMPSYLNSTQGDRTLLSYGHIPESALSNAATRWTARARYDSLRGLHEAVVDHARSAGPGLAYAYWPALDACCHEHGSFHPTTMAHFDDIDEMLASLAEAVEGTNTVLLVTADHGLVDTPRDRYLDLSRVKGLYDCLATLPSGDSRQLSFFVRPALRREFRACCAELKDAGVLVPGSRLLRGGFFGPGDPHASLNGRVGDYVLIARENFAFEAPPAGVPASRIVGTHGGMSAEEMRVPLFTVS